MTRLSFILVLFTLGCKSIITTHSTSVEDYQPLSESEIDSINQVLIQGIEPIENPPVFSTAEPIEFSEGMLDVIKADSFTFIGVGDMMLGTNFPSADYLPKNQGKDLLSPVADFLRSADVTFGNLEGVILNEGGTPKNCNNPETCYIFRSPEYMIRNLLDAGFDVLSTANNHVNDFGLAGRTNTAKVLSEYGVPFAGFNTHPYSIFEKNGLKIGFAAFAPHSGTMSFFDIKTATEIVSMLDKETDIVIVSFHAGAEGKDAQHILRKEEKFLGANRGDVYKFSRTMIDAGADIIFGHGPHVTRAVDLYKNRFIAYSLGNFCTYNRFNLQGVNGYAPAIKVYTNKQGEFLKAEVLSIIQYRPGGPVPDKNNNAFKLIQQLTNSDIPEANLRFDSNSIFKKN